MENIMKDDRFAHIVKDHRFRTVPVTERRVKIDKRFKGMFSDKKFNMKYTIDKRGRPVNLSTNEDLHRFYELDSDEEESDGDESGGKKSKLKKKKKTLKEATKTRKDIKDDKNRKKANAGINQTEEAVEDDGDSSDRDDVEISSSSDSEDEVEENKPDVKGTDLARGEGNLESSSDDDDDDEDVGTSVDTGLDHKWSELDKTAPEAKELGRRLAVCTLDWDRIKAVDIFVLLHSFLPTGGVLHSVKIFPSEFGLARMKEEDIKGPTELVNSTKVDDCSSGEEETEDAEGTKYHREKLRQYQINRLKYYYAVAEFDSIEAANTIYGECDGMEYESSSTRLDLRFIPDDMTFDEHEPKSTCSSMPSNSVYKPSLFQTSALCQSKVDLTWDETDHDRLKVTMRPPSKVDTATEDDFKAYLASSSGEENDFGVGSDDDDNQSEESETEEKQIDKYRKLLQNIQETEEEKERKDVEMEVTWEPGLKQITENLLKKKKEEEGSTTWEQYLLKKREKKRQKREERQVAAQKEKLEKKAKTKGKKQQAEDTDEDAQGRDEVAFSDDDMPGGVDLSEFQDSLGGGDTNAKKRKKKKKKQPQLTEEEKEEKEKQEAELSLLMMDEKEADKRHFNMKDLVEENTSKKKKKKKLNKLNKLKQKSKPEDDFKVDVTDDRFTAMYSSHMYNLDPTAPEYKRTKGMEAIVEEKQKRRQHSQQIADSSRKRKETHDSSSEPRQKLKKDRNVMEASGQDSSLALLINSVKTKTQRYNIKSKR